MKLARLTTIGLMWVMLAGGTHAGTFGATQASTPVVASSWSTPAFTPSAQWDGNGQIQIEMAVSPGQMLYRNQIQVQPSAGWILDPVVWPRGTPGVGGEPVFTTSVVTHVRVRPDRPSAPLVLTMNFQGCSTQGVCHPPVQTMVTLPAPLSKPTLVVLSGTWCGPCRAQDRRLADPSLQAALSSWHVVQLNVPNDESAAAILKGYGVVGVPALRMYSARDAMSAQSGSTLLGEQPMAQLRRALTASVLP